MVTMFNVYEVASYGQPRYAIAKDGDTPDEVEPILVGTFKVESDQPIDIDLFGRMLEIDGQSFAFDSHTSYQRGAAEVTLYGVPRVDRTFAVSPVETPITQTVYRCKFDHENAHLPECPLSHIRCDSPCDIVAQTFGTAFSYPNVLRKPGVQD